jgi:hypothetical protein
MAETILIPFVYPDCTIIQSYPYKFVLNDNSFEFFARHTVDEWDEEKSMKIIQNYDSRVKMVTSAISGFEMYRSAEHEGFYIFKISTATGEISMYFDSKQSATELYNKFDKWLFTDANS